MKDKSDNKADGIASRLTEGMGQLRAGFMQTITGPRFIRRSYVGYFAPVIAGCRLSKKRNWHYLRILVKTATYNAPNPPPEILQILHP
ncbi:hypothetical protein [Gallionella capsiferriformans]|uniref:Uncharacterized protein n=1 Tax=Gallionella capsiferriformans (strain ES-2) TaxID=395494 RepID=D9SDJ7_GALCS|nr:hypothetical protein [Gallionella capsiferriformans]ADL54754.1 hypothetical protein Galf_0715 [Gallionella capsiferriformans ES-2]